jgi:hypothetical protein
MPGRHHAHPGILRGLRGRTTYRRQWPAVALKHAFVLLGCWFETTPAAAPTTPSAPCSTSPPARGQARGAGSQAALAHHRETGRHVSPESPRTERNLRVVRALRGAAVSRLFAGVWAQLEGLRRTSENRGVPGSRPGLAILGPRVSLASVLVGARPPLAGPLRVIRARTGRPRRIYASGPVD